MSTPVGGGAPTDPALPAPLPGQGTPAAERMAGVYLVGPDKVAVLTVEQADAMVGIGKSIQDQSGTIRQADRLADLVGFMQRLRDVLVTACSSAVRIDVSAAEAGIATFLLNQTLARADLAWRVRHVCRTCGQAQLSNPSYDALMKRRQAMLTLTRSVGMVIMPGHIAPYLMVNSLLGFAKVNPDYVCARCKGMEADESVVVFCPSCRAECGQAVLKTCKRCQHEFLKGVGVADLWRPLGAVALPAAAGTKLTEFVLDEDPIALAFLPDGRLVMATTSSIRLWQVAGGDVKPREVWARAVPGHVSLPLIGLSRDGALVAVARKGSNEVTVLRTADGVEITKIPTPTSGVSDLAFSPDGQAVAVTSISAYALNLSGQKVATYPMGVLGVPTFVVYSPDGTLAAIDSWMSIFIFPAAGGARLNKITLGGDTARALAWSPRPDLLAVGISAVARLIQMPSGTTVAEFKVDAKVTKIAFSVDARYLAVAAEDCSARVFDLVTNTESARISRPSPVTAVAFAPNGTLAIADESRTVQFWSPPREERDLAIEGPGRQTD
jgi:anaphase-promoting complex subunit 4/WD40 domain-containing protein